MAQDLSGHLGAHLFGFGNRNRCQQEMGLAEQAHLFHMGGVA